MLKISIPKPCHEDWNAMTANQQGRHCTSCAKTVVDFTQMSDEEVKHFLINKKEEKLCGRFNNTQLHRIRIELPQDILYINMPSWKRFLAACLIVFSTTLFSCDVSTKGEPVIDHTQSATSPAYRQADSIIIGKPGIPDSSYVWDSQPLMGVVCMPVIDSPKFQLQGDIAIIPDEPIKDYPVDTVTVGELIAIPDSIIPVKKDTVLKKSKLPDPPKTDTGNCNSKVYY